MLELCVTFNKSLSIEWLGVSLWHRKNVKWTLLLRIEGCLAHLKGWVTQAQADVKVFSCVDRYDGSRSVSRNQSRTTCVTILCSARYCSEVWGHCNKTLSNKLQKFQKRAARILTFSSYDTSADLLFEQLSWKRLDTQRQIQVAAMVFKFIHVLASDYLGSLFSRHDSPYSLL